MLLYKTTTIAEIRTPNRKLKYSIPHHCVGIILKRFHWLKLLN